MRKIIAAAVLLLALSVTVYAAEPVKVAVIDSGISESVVPAGSLLEGRNYIRPAEGTGDKIGHGTAIGAIIVGMENGKIAGICPTARLVPLVSTTLDENNKQVSADTGLAAKAIRDAVDLYGCRIINLSSGTTHNNAKLREAVEYAASKGVLVVSCAGNGGGTAYSYPGSYESVLCVGACDEYGVKAGFSQDNDRVDLLARGTKLSIASLRGTRIRGQGTSYAAALVTGTAAQLWTMYPDLTAAQLQELLLDSCLTVDGRLVLDPAAALAAKPDFAPEVELPEMELRLRAVEKAVLKGLGGIVSAAFGRNPALFLQ